MFDDHFVAQFPETTQEQTLTQLTTFLKEGSSCQLIGLAGVGRATVLNLLVYNKAVRKKHLAQSQKEMHFVIVDFAEIRNRPLIDVMKYLFLNLTESLRERGMKVENKAVGDIFREHLKFQDELVLFQGFKEAIDYMALEKKISTVFLFSRFEEYISTVSADFFANLRALRSRAKYRFSIVFSVPRPLEELLEPNLLSDFYEFIVGNTIYMPIADEVSREYWLTHIAKITQKKLSPEQIKEVTLLTGGHASLTKLSFEALFRTNETISSLEAFLLQQKTIQAALTSLWESFTPAEQAQLRKKQVEQGGYLEKAHVMESSTITIPLLHSFIDLQKITNEHSQTKIIYDESTKTIQKGTAMISDQLTAAEFRLLVYLIQHEDRIVERDELIGVVWGDNKSTAGITDQAVDQLVFRVRRKIEDDPNHPTHLQTVKGRGFKFSA